MNKHVLLTMVLAVLAVALIAIAQEGGDNTQRGGGRFQNMTEEQRAQLRERFQNMTEEERAQMRARFAGRMRMSREDQLASIKKVEDQLAKLKTDIQNAPAPQNRNFRDMSEEERTKFREERTKEREARQAVFAAINDELNKLNPPRPAPEQIENLRELRDIRALAEKEKATETAKRLAALVEKQAQQIGPMMMMRGGSERGAARTTDQ